MKFIQSIHAFVGSNIVEQPGELRKYDVSMGGTKWKPELPTAEKMNSLIEEYQNSLSTNATDTILTFMCKLMKMQAFNDGNKRTSVIFANHYLISKGKGLIVIPDNLVSEYKNLLINYYESDIDDEIMNFLMNKCYRKI